MSEARILKKAIGYLLTFMVSLSSLTGFCQQVIPPEPYGGERLLREFIKEEMVYPDMALQQKTEGKVVLSFLVTPEGMVQDIEVVQKVSDEVDAEAIRIFKKILWYPATELGIPIAYNHTMEIGFAYKKYLKWVKNRGYEQHTFPHEPVDGSHNVYQITDVEQLPKPVYDSKNYNFSSFVANNLKYPDAAFKQNISGTVELKFVVEPSGRISNITINKAVGGGCTEEAIRVIRLVKWNPGIRNGEAVRTGMCADITFNLAHQSVEGTIPTPGQVY